jgi:hypothetical protein
MDTDQMLKDAPERFFAKLDQTDIDRFMTAVIMSKIDKTILRAEELLDREKYHGELITRNSMLEILRELKKITDFMA